MGNTLCDDLFRSRDDTVARLSGPCREASDLVFQMILRYCRVLQESQRRGTTGDVLAQEWQGLLAVDRRIYTHIAHAPADAAQP